MNDEPYKIIKNKSKIFEGKYLIVKPNGDILGMIKDLVQAKLICEFFGVDYEIIV